jgi:membrane fusion protein, multidrug efflux system
MNMLASITHFLVWRKSHLLSLAGAAVVAAAIIGCNKEGGAAVMPARPPAPVTVAAAVSRDVPIYIDEIGKCAAVEMVNVFPQVAGQITDLHFKDGADLKKDDLLFTIDKRPYEAAVHQAKAMLAKDKAAAENAAAFAKRQLEVFNLKSISAADYDQARFAAGAADAAVQADQAALETANINLAFCEIRSPIDGVAGQHLVDRGNVVKANEGNMLVIQQMDPIYADFTINEKQLSAVRENMARGTLKALTKTPGDEGDGREGQLTFLDNAVKDGSGTVKLRATIPNQDRHFWPGQFVDVRLVLSVKKDAVLVPSMATQLGQTGNFVFAIKHDGDKTIAEQRPVKLGQPQGDWVVVEGNIQAGDEVVTEGQNGVMPNGPVHILSATPAAQQTASAQK